MREEPPTESSLDYWLRMIQETKSLAALKDWWTPFGAKGGRLWDFPSADREKLIQAKEERKKALGGK